MRPLEIALATPMLVKSGDGQGRVNYEIARGAVERGHRVTVLATTIDAEVAADPRYRCIRPPDYRIPSNFLSTQASGFHGSRILRARRRAFDIVHANGSYTISDADVNTAHFVHGAWLHSPFHTSRVRPGLFGAYHAALTRLYAYQDTLSYARSRTVVAVSGLVRRELESAGVDPAKIRVIPNGVDCEAFRPGHEDRAALGLPADGFLVLFAGDMATPRKNVESILRALQAAPDVHLVAVGSLRANPYPALARELGLADRVTFLGFRSDMAQLMRAVDAFVFPSRYDTFALVVLEALASGLPVVTASTVGAAELAAEAGCPVLEDPDDVARLAAELRALAAVPARTKALGAAARDVALRCTWQRMSEQYLDVYERLAATRDAELRRPQRANAVDQRLRGSLELVQAGALEIEHGPQAEVERR
jgi:glycosyltransferase involved in cell wall biosynthesis